MADLREIPAPGLTALHGRPDPLPGLPQGPGWVRLGQATVLWTGPGQWLCFHPPEQDLPVAAAQRTPMPGARRVFEVSGPDARDRLARILPIDLHPRAFPHGAAAATLGAHLPLLVWRDGEAFRLACFRSYGESLRAALVAAQRGASTASA